jgi:hypothetical protein
MPVKMEDNINFTTEVQKVILKINNRMIIMTQVSLHHKHHLGWGNTNMLGDNNLRIKQNCRYYYRIGWVLDCNRHIRSKKNLKFGIRKIN